ncbi:MAG: cadmium-translocating P-type ATPase [Spirochaetaceae bacterium]|nr:cadmium-translocating P-type ATPase [Spirochaetaceae bacterium]
MTKKQKNTLIRIIITAVLLAIIKIVPLTELLASAYGVDIADWRVTYTEMAVYLIPFFVIGSGIIKKAIKGIIKLQPFDENFLMTVASVGGIILGNWDESVFVMLFYQVGELFESIAVGKSRRNISALMDIRPDFANIEGENGELVQVSPDEVAVGTIIAVKPGERIPIDGIIESGETTLDTSALTGESIPREVNIGDEVSSGCINLSGFIKLRTTKPFGESTASRILDLVENASSKKARQENFISKFARVYTPTVCLCALALAVIPPLFRMLVLSMDADFGDWVYRALTFLVISCPCALVISIPLGFFAGIGSASKNGVLVKGSNYIEALSKVKYIVFDKTGTMTKGVFEVSGIHHSPMDDEKLLEIAAFAESYSNHPISLSLQRAYGKPIDKSRVTDVKEISGHGIEAFVDGKKVLAGNAKLMARYGIEYMDCHCTGTIVHVAIDGAYAGHIVISDIVKPDSAEAVAKLKKLGIKKTVMLTGDNQKSGEETASGLGIDEVYCNLLPGDKVTKVEELLGHKGAKENLAFVGDGINDAPVLSRADVGIAMGALGSDAAIEAADVVLMDDNPLKIVKAMKVAKKCLRIVYENIFFAIGVKVVCLGLGAVGVANMWMAIFADVGVTVIAVLNSIRNLQK